MLKIEKIKEEILNYKSNNDERLCCYLGRLSTNSDYSTNCYRKNMECSECLRLSLLDLLGEYKKPVKLSKFEYEYLKFAKENEYNFIARDKNNHLYLYPNKPWKGELIWNCIDGNTPVFSELFKFVKWEDEEPYSINSILSNCEVIEDE